MKPMYQPFDNGWLKIGNVAKIKQEDVGVQYKFKRKLKEAYMPEQDIDKNVWILKATPAVLEKIYKGKTWNFATPPASMYGPIKRTSPTSRFPASVPIWDAGISGERTKCSARFFYVPAI